MSRKKFFLVSFSIVLIIGVLSFALVKGEVRDERPKRIEENSIGVIDFEEIKANHNLNSQIRHLEERIANHRLTHNNEIENLVKTQENIDKHLGSFNEQLERRLELLQERAVEGIKFRREEMEKELIEYHSSLEEDMVEDLMEFKNGLIEEMEKEVGEVRANFNSELKKYKAEVNRKYNSDIINLRMRTNQSHLSDEEREKAEVKLEELMGEREREIIEIEDYYDNKLEKIITEKEEVFEGELLKYRESLEREFKETLLEKERTLEEELSAYINAEEKRLEEEMKEKERELRAEIEGNLIDSQDRLVKRAKSKVRGLEVEIERLEKQILNLRNNKINDIDKIIEEIAKEKGIDLVINNYVDNIDGNNITKDIIKEINIER
ncbi:hypothetical protein [Halonatronum saccharophilum]|uniref:hypothetical protein n=1 Tax=Halonatronum saccharophilum TaxID=150060 RepID=UPI0004881E46|nr:hypothetical protein [Halonatronum saccharophilum]